MSEDKTTKQETFYIAGPMAGLRCMNHPAFFAAERLLRAAFPGRRILNPARNRPESEYPEWKDWMRLAIPQVAEADVVYMLPGWEKSRGARLEHFLALQLEARVEELEQKTLQRQMGRRDLAGEEERDAGPVFSWAVHDEVRRGVGDFVSMCELACSRRRENKDGRCLDYTSRGRTCPDCPRDWSEELEAKIEFHKGAWGAD